MSATRRMYAGFIGFGALLLIGGAVQYSGPSWFPSCGVARDDISEGSTVPVVVSRINRRSVAIIGK